MRNLGRLIVQMSTGMVSYNRVMNIIKRKPRAAGHGRLHAAQRSARRPDF
jgi:hypothetical protein